jgi:hypothetical protein
MHAKRYLLVTLLSALLWTVGCSKGPGQTQVTPTSGNKASTAGPAPNAAVADNLPAADAPAPGTEASQGGQSEAPPKLVLLAGTSITIRLQERLSSASAVPGERFEAIVDEPVVVGDRVVVPVGSVVQGHVILARHSGRLRHPGQLGLTLDTVTVDQQIISLHTAHVVARGGSHKKRNWGWIGGGTGGGALIGALAAGGKGALIGSSIGAAAGTTTAFITGKKDVVFGNERRLRFRLNQDVSLFG